VSSEAESEIFEEGQPSILPTRGWGSTGSSFGGVLGACIARLKGFLAF